MSKMINGLFPGRLEPNATVAGCINIYENVWPEPHKTIKAAEEQCSNPDSGAFWTNAETIGLGVFQNARTNKVLGITHLAEVSQNPILKNIHNQFYALILAGVAPYTEKFNILEGIWHEPYGLLRYRGGEEYKAHYDSTTSMGRIISVIVYLNDDYEGGELEFPNFGIKIKPQAGMMVVFPSNFAYAHIAHPVTSGTKYALVTWLQDRPPA